MTSLAFRKTSKGISVTFAQIIIGRLCLGITETIDIQNPPDVKITSEIYGAWIKLIIE